MNNFIFVSVTVVLVARALPAESGNPRPNVLFLVVDDMKDWVNCLGGYEGRVRTPNIDRLAKRGMLFTNAHCPSPKCAPSRAAVLTGMRPSTTGLYDNGHWWYPNLPGVVTIPRQFQRSGYHVVGAGKIFHHTAGNHPPNQWDEFQRLKFREDPWFRGVKLNYPWSEHRPFPQRFPFSGIHGLGHENDWGSLNIPERDYDDELTAEFAIRFLESRTNRTRTPFFLACGFFRPHLPWYVPQRFFDLYSLNEIVLPPVAENDLNDLPSEGRALAKARRQHFELIRDAGKWRNAIQAYLASITCVDDRIGRVFNALERGQHYENTIVVLWSDHGWHLGEKGHWHKSTLWEEATRVPFLISVPGFRSGKCDRPVSLLDLPPTLYQLVGFPENPAHDGVSLVPLLREPSAAWNRPAVIEYRRGNAAVRSERYRYIRYRNGGEEFYDHQSDPHEWENLASSRTHADIKRQLSAWITTDWAESASTKSAYDFDYQSFTWTQKQSGVTIRGDRQ